MPLAASCSKDESQHRPGANLLPSANLVASTGSGFNPCQSPVEAGFEVDLGGLGDGLRCGVVQQATEVLTRVVDANAAPILS